MERLYTVHFQKGGFGARRLNLVRVEAATEEAAIAAAKRKRPDLIVEGFRVIATDLIDDPGRQ